MDNLKDHSNASYAYDFPFRFQQIRIFPLSFLFAILPCTTDFNLKLFFLLYLKKQILLPGKSYLPLVVLYLDFLTNIPSPSTFNVFLFFLLNSTLI